MRARLAIIVVLVSAKVAMAQIAYPTTAAPVSSWGGHAVPAQVPYQPSLPAAPTTAPVCADPVWQTYPHATPDVNAAPSGVLPPVEIVPSDAPIFVPEAPIYPQTPEPSLRESLTPPDARNGFFQKAKFTATWLPQLGEDDLGWTDLRSEVVTALPFFTRENPIIITPSYELHFLDRPANLDLPPRLHDLAIDFHVFRVIDNQWIADFAVTPGVFADDHSFDSDEALRVNGRAVGVYAPNIDLKWVLGVTYVNGGWAKVVPVAGVIYTPTDDVAYELVFPQPRVAWRLPNSPIPGRDERWFYIKAEYGNAAWAFQQDDGTEDVLASRDYRFIAGLERKIVGGLSRRVELGWVFNRDIKIASISGDDIDMGDTILVRAGLSY
jgi:hypothetical protein